MRQSTAYGLISVISISVVLCCSNDDLHDMPEIHEIPGKYVYCVVEHNDSLYFSTQNGEICRFVPDDTASLVLVGRKSHVPLRTIAFTKDNRLYASSYETSVQDVLPDTLISLPKMSRWAWAMKLDKEDNIWLAGRQGLFHEVDDSLIRITKLREVYDIDFYLGKLVAAHWNGVTFYDSSTGIPETTFCKKTVFWTIAVFDSLLVCGGMNKCLLMKDGRLDVISIPKGPTIPWAFARDSVGNIYFAAETGLFRIKSGTKKVENIGYKGKCIKSIYLDKKGRLWIGKYFNG